jgi:hypothetical protein
MTPEKGQGPVPTDGAPNYPPAASTTRAPRKSERGLTRHQSTRLGALPIVSAHQYGDRFISTCCPVCGGAHAHRLDGRRFAGCHRRPSTVVVDE